LLAVLLVQWDQHQVHLKLARLVVGMVARLQHQAVMVVREVERVLPTHQAFPHRDKGMPAVCKEEPLQTFRLTAAVVVAHAAQD
jgi:hypothetical protein